MDFVHPSWGQEFAMLVEMLNGLNVRGPEGSLREGRHGGGFLRAFLTQISKTFRPHSPRLNSLKPIIFSMSSAMQRPSADQAWADSKPAPMGAINPDSGESQFWISRARVSLRSKLQPSRPGRVKQQKQSRSGINTRRRMEARLCIQRLYL